jgi:hypothetical protein
MSSQDIDYDRLMKVWECTIHPELRKFEGQHATTQLRELVKYNAIRLLHECGFRELTVDILYTYYDSIICNIRRMTREEIEANKRNNRLMATELD